MNWMFLFGFSFGFGLEVLYYIYKYEWETYNIESGIIEHADGKGSSQEK